MDVTLHVWRQASPDKPGRLVEYPATGISTDASFLEMLDIVNHGLIERGEDPIAFSHDCREGICGSCSLMINGEAHGPMRGTATCQLHKGVAILRYVFRGLMYLNMSSGGLKQCSRTHSSTYAGSCSSADP